MTRKMIKQPKKQKNIRPNSTVLCLIFGPIYIQLISTYSIKGQIMFGLDHYNCNCNCLFLLSSYEIRFQYTECTKLPTLVTVVMSSIQLECLTDVGRHPRGKVAVFLGLQMKTSYQHCFWDTLMYTTLYAKPRFF